MQEVIPTRKLPSLPNL